MPLFEGLEIARSAKDLISRFSAQGTFDKVTGIKDLQLWNCNTFKRDVFIWLYDNNSATWTDFGALKASYDGFVCPAGGSVAMVVPLPERHLYTLTAVEVDGFICKANKPLEIGCQHAVWGPLFGDPKGVSVPYIIP
jgi:hypothetical protein